MRHHVGVAEDPVFDLNRAKPRESPDSPNSNDQFQRAISSMAEGCESSALNSRRRKAQ